jgi:hypothetical protein
MANVHLDLIRINKPKQEGTHYTSLFVDDRLPMPSVGDDVVVTKGKRTSVFRVQRRLFHYINNSLYLQLYFTKST